MYQTINGLTYKVEGTRTFTLVDHDLRRESYANDTVYKTVIGKPVTLVVMLHSFSGDETEIIADPAKSAMLSLQDVVVICPRVYGPAGNPNTCGSPAQLKLINDIIQKAKADYSCRKVILTGVSGGAGLGATFIGAYPGVVQGASLWVGYNDLAQWYAESLAAGHIYDDLLLQTLGGTPTQLPSIYRSQSPSGVLSAAKDCTVYINDGVLDTEIPHHHRTDMRDQLLALPASANVNCQYIAYPDMGHSCDYSVTVSQINSMK